MDEAMARARQLGSMRVGLALALGGLALVSSCGARTGLDLAPRDAAAPADAATPHDAPIADDAADATDAPPIDTGPLPCVPESLALSPATPTVLFVLDRSGSMSTVFDAGQSRWRVLVAGLASTLPSVDSTMEIGGLVFPSDGRSTCTVPTPFLSPGLDRVAALVADLQAITPSGGTPTADAIDVATQAILSVRAASSARALVLATDGGPDCNAALDPGTCTCSGATGRGGRCRSADQCLDDTRTVDRIAASLARGVPTYVIGISGDVIGTDVLQRMALAGGRPLVGGVQAYYAARSAADLQSALAAIRDQVALCTYLTASVPDAHGAIAVTIGGATIREDATDGWSWANRDNGELRLSGAACTLASSMARPMVAATITCGP